MDDDNKHNILFFEGASMRELHATMEGWQNANKKRFLSMSIQKEGEGFCCIALTNPSEVVIVSKGTFGASAHVTPAGSLAVRLHTD